MPLNPQQLRDDLKSFLDPTYKHYTNPPKSILEAAEKWTTAISKYFALVGPISVTIPASISIAHSTMYSSVLTALNSHTFNTQFDMILQQFCLQLSSGFTPLYVATPPIGIPNVAPIFAQQRIRTDYKFIEQLVIAIDAWARTGTATTVSTPPVTMIWF